MKQRLTCLVLHYSFLGYTLPVALSITLAGSHLGLRRHSFSAPPRLAVCLISDCLERLDNLSGRVTRLTERTKEERLGQVREQLLLVPGPIQRSQSVGDLHYPDLLSENIAREITDEVLTMVLNEVPLPKSKVKSPVCHKCHTPLSNEVHTGVPSGVGRCPLEHWHGCKGGISGGKDGKGKDWTACPTMLSSDEESDSDSERDDDTDLASPDRTVNTLGGEEKFPESLSAAAASLENGLTGKSRLAQDLSPLSTLVQSKEHGESSSSEDEELLEQRAEFDKLQKQLEQLSLDNKAAEKAERKEAKRLKVVQEKEELARQTQILREKQALLSSQSRSATVAAINSSSFSGTRPKDLKDKVAEHEAKKAQKAAAKLAKQQQKQGDVVTMSGIRALPDVRREVEDYITRLKAIVPTISTDPTAGGFSSTTFQPEGVHVGGNVGSTVQPQPKQKYVYVEELGQAIPVVDSLGDLPAAGKLRSTRPVPTMPEVDVVSDTESECSSDEDCPVEPESGMKFAWKRHNDGSKYFKLVPAHDQSPDMLVTYQLDKATGNYERVLVPRPEQKKAAVKSGQGKAAHKSSSTAKVSTPSVTPVYKDHRVAHSRVARVPVRTQERQPSFVSGDPDKLGKESRLPSLVQFARDCPVSWTNKVTSNGLNPLLFSWAYIAELLATRTGQAPSLPNGELEARLQHFLSVLEVTLQTTAQTDFASDSWKVARLYHQKVQDKVDAGVYTWLQLSDQWGTATLPHELMAANAELAPRLGRKKGEKSPTKRRGDSDRRGDFDQKVEDKRPCSSWNNSETRGKCKWEVDNEGRKCNRQHFCSWCKSENNQTNFHQKTFCKKRIEKEGE